MTRNSNKRIAVIAAIRRLFGNTPLVQINSLTPTELQLKLDQPEDIKLIDVRYPFGYEISDLNGILVPTEEVLDHISKKDKLITSE